MLEALGQAALRILLLACIVQLAMWLFRIRQTQLRLVGWTVVLAASLAMPALQQVTPLQTAIAFDIPSPAMLGIARPQLPTPESGLAETVLADAVDPSRAMGVWLETAYFLVGGTLLLRLIIGVALSLRLLRRASPIGAAWAAGIRVRISPDVTAPVTVLNVILLPADIAQWPASMRQSVLAHERAHVARWDYAMLLASQVNRVVFWFSPFAWWLHRRLTTLAELASDDNALQVTGDRAGYAEVLLEMGRRSGPLLRGLAMARPATLVYRIERVLRDGEPPKSVGRAQRSLVVIGAAGLAFAAASPDWRADLAAQPDAPPLEREAAVPSGTSRSVLARAADDVPGMARMAEQKAAPNPPPPHAAPTTPSAGPPAPQPRPAMRVASRPSRRLVARDTLPVPPLRQASWTNRQAGGVDEVYPASAKPNAGSEAPPVSSHQSVPPAAAESRLLKLIDQQTCSGVYLPGASGVFPGDWLNLVSAKFFRNADGAPWMTWHVGGRTPVNVPVKLTGNDIEFTGMQAVTFKVLPKGSNHLTGTTQPRYGTIDLACGGSNAHLWDGTE